MSFEVACWERFCTLVGVDRFPRAPLCYYPSYPQRLKKLLELPHVDDKNYERVCLYLLRMADYMSDPDDLLVSGDRFCLPVQYAGLKEERTEHLGTAERIGVVLIFQSTFAGQGLRTEPFFSWPQSWWVGPGGDVLFSWLRALLFPCCLFVEGLGS